jgi:hypothetical protein
LRECRPRLLLIVEYSAGNRLRKSSRNLTNLPSHRWAQPCGRRPDPDQNLYLNYGCGGELNYNGYCSPAVDKLIDRQSIEADQEQSKQLVWEIERKLAEDGARPIIFLRPPRDLLAAMGERADDHGQQHLQRCAFGRRLARQIEVGLATA